ncbi:ComEC/Rec2 family competence protein [Candidatus Babeliales bacterium]|nr:ComEC/Rec2 family competence protein [Candidatus Babeliales bacterium]
MNQQISRMNFIPLTHILLTCTITTILTALAIFQNQMIWIIPLYLCAISFCLIKKQYLQIAILFLCSLFSVQIYFKIQNTKTIFQANKNFLNVDCIVKAIIVQKQTNCLDKEQTTIILKTSNIYNEHAGTIHESKKIVCTLTARRALKFFEGQSITIYKAILQQPNSDSEYQKYLIKEGIWATTFITSEKILINNYKDRSLFAKVSDQFCALLHTNTINLFNPLFLGKREKSIESVTIQHQSLYWGIAHHMARSGIHLVTLFGLFMALFHYIRIQHFYRYIIGAALMLIYFEMSIPSISFLRALCMIMLQIISKINKFQYSSVHALTLTTLLIITYNPWYILFLDFQLSFGITAVIIWLFQAKWSKTVAFQPKTLIPS